MALGFLKIFKKEKAAPEVAAPPPPLEKPASERLARTIVPNAIRALEAEPAPVIASPAPVAAPAIPTPPAPPPPRRTISLGEPSAFANAVGDGPSPAAPLPAAPAVSGSPNERTIALALGELLPQIPAELLEPSQVDSARTIIFPAALLEIGMANGRPAVPLHAIYQQAAQIFRHEILSDDPREVVLPFNRVLHQFANFQVRDDQEFEEPFAEVETPLSQVAAEESVRFGVSSPATPAPPVAPKKITPTVTLPSPPAPPPEKIAPPPEKAAPMVVLPSPFAPAPTPPPKPAPEIPPPAPVHLPLPVLPNESPAAAESAPLSAAPPNEPAAAAASPETITPNGTGVPATERVPASSGSPVPIRLPAPFAPAPPPAAIHLTPVETATPVVPNEPPPSSAKMAEEQPPVQLSLRNVLRGIPPFQFTGRIEEIPEHAQLEVPFALIAPQLSLGKVEISPADFQAAMPEEFRSLFLVDDGGLPVALPLQEVLAHLPEQLFRLRADQEEVTVTQTFETPFSLKAAEDAERLHVPPEPVSIDALVAEEELTTPLAESPAASEPSLPEVPEQPAISVADPVIEPAPPLDAKSAVEEAIALPGISACVLVFSDGLTLAGSLPAEYGADAVCAMAPEIIRRIGNQTTGQQLGALHSVTLHYAQVTVSFFARGNICLTTLQSDSALQPATRARLNQLAEELGQTYAQPAPHPAG